MQNIGKFKILNFNLFFNFCLTGVACFIFRKKNYFYRCLPLENLFKIFAIFARKNSAGIFTEKKHAL
jgi:hypothetical protein